MMFRTILVIMFLALIKNSFSQVREEQFQKLADKIRKSTFFDSSSVFRNGQEAIQLARKGRDRSKEGLIYRYYGDFHFYSGRPDLAVKYYDTTLILARKAQDTTLINSARIRKTFILSGDNPKNAENDFRKLLETSLNRGDRMNALECYNGLGIIYEGKHDQAGALDYYYKALGMGEKLDDAYLQGMVLNNIGLIKYRNQQYDEAIKDFEKALEFAKVSENVRLSFNLENNMGLLHEKKQEYEKSLTHFKKSLINAKRIGFPFNIAITHLNLSSSYNLNRQYDMAVLHADSTIRIFEEINDLKHIAKPYLIMAESYMKKDSSDRALLYAEKALFLAGEQENTEDIIEGLRMKSLILKAQGNFELAMKYFEQYHSLEDSISEISSKERFTELQVIYETKKKEADLREEKARTAVLEADQKLNETRMLFVIIGGVFLTISVAVILYLRQLKITEEYQRNFNRKLIESIDEERSRISRDLHDDIGQSLSVIKSRIGSYQKGQTTDLTGLENNLGDLIEQTREISHRLHPSYLEKIGLRRSAISLLDKVEKSTGLITSHEIVSSVDSLSLDKQTQVYRILQECLSNTLKHANAKSVRLIIKEDSGEFELIYMDNGKGFESHGKKEGLGLMTMKERAAKISAKLIIEQSYEKGFKLTLRFR
ncbi:MAG: tetratricopeptide repeat protein [Brumimicrobium sp.]|nr:tetratricopeptide repeat protein [Brumimicrobium sp.]